GHDRVDVGRQGGERGRVGLTGDDQFGVALGEARALDVEIGPGVIGEQNFVAGHGGASEVDQKSYSRPKESCRCRAKCNILSWLRDLATGPLSRTFFPR